MYHDPQVSRDQLSKCLRQLATKGADLYRRAEAGEPMGARELALAIEYNQQYVDILAELEDMDIEILEGAAVEVML